MRTPRLLMIALLVALVAAPLAAQAPDMLRHFDDLERR